MVDGFNAWSVFLCILSSAVAAWSALRAIRASELPPKSLRSFESRLRSLEDSTEEAHQLLKDMANRLKMMKVRRAVDHGQSSQDDPDPFRDPEGWRKVTNARIALGELSKRGKS